MSDPQVLFLDEPTVGLDPRIRHELLDVIADLRTRREMTVLVTTHYLDEAERLCDRVAIIHAGRIVALDTPAALLAGLGREIVELRVAGDPGSALSRLRARGVAGGDAFAVGATVTVPLHDRGAGDAITAIGRARPRARDRHAQAHARRRLPAPHRRSPRRGRLTTSTNRSQTMSTATEIATLPRRGIAFPGLGSLVTLARRRCQLTVRTPRELVVPLVTPILFALVIAPALKDALHTSAGYESLVAVGTVGLLIPLNTMFSGLSVIGDREQGAQRELLAAPIRRSLLVFGNLVVALAITGFQVVTLLAFALARGIDFNASGSGIIWFVASAVLFAVGMYGVAETLASRVPKQDEYISRVPAIAIVPWFLAGSLFPISALPELLTWITKFLPLTHGLAVMRYGLLGDASGLHNIWGAHDATAMATLSLLVVAAFATLMVSIAIRTFTRAASQ